MHHMTCTDLLKLFPLCDISFACCWLKVRDRVHITQLMNGSFDVLYPHCVVCFLATGSMRRHNAHKREINFETEKWCTWNTRPFFDCM